ncbi:MAG TPA: sigma 54-interacting transcriptional regulator [Gemmataceae bacterium]|nr:sigma 54-interacting transcriptional regulator [Gemmataceae bacterium]
MDDFRWQSLFQHVREPLFVLDRLRRVRFVNRAWEELTGLSAAAVHGKTCTRRRAPDEGFPEELARVLCPPAEVLRGRPGQVRRWVEGLPAGSGRRWWDVEFFPLRGEQGLACVLGRITCLPAPGASAAASPLTDALAALPEVDKPLRPERLAALRERLAGRYRLDLLESELPAVRRALDQARLASQTRAAVLLVGEPGCGKHWLARAIHRASAARERAFVLLDCARLPPVALAEALFGGGGLWHRPGVGTIYLREPAGLPHDLQNRLRDLLAESAWADPPAGPRVLAGCRADPMQDVYAGRLREDFCAALSTLVIHLPPLRERLADLPLFVERMLDRLAEADDEPRQIGLTPAAWELVREHRWPGNLRELHEVLAGCRARAVGGQIDVADLPAYLRLAVSLEKQPASGPGPALPLDRLLGQAERRIIELALARARGHKAQAAELLDIPYPKLFRRMHALGIADVKAIKKRKGEKEPDEAT